MLTVNRPGSLITPTYFLSAAHCNNILIPMPPVGNKDKVRQTWSGSKTCWRFVRWDSYMYSLPRLMNTEKSVWGQQKMMVFLRWIVFSPSDNEWWVLQHLNILHYLIFRYQSIWADFQGLWITSWSAVGWGELVLLNSLRNQRWPNYPWDFIVQPPSLWF